MAHRGEQPTGSAEAMAELERGLRGHLERPGTGGYDRARALWNSKVDRMPAFVVRPSDVADVVLTVEVAHTHDLGITVKCGGHGIAGRAIAEGAILVDLAEFDDVRVDGETRRAWVEGGATWGALNEQTAKVGMVAPGITHPSVGVGGYTVGGGIGPLARSQGLAIDALRSVEVVTAAGELVRASETSHQELFWALRGGGGGFGIVTAFEFDLRPIETPVLRGTVLYRMEDAPTVLRAHRDFFSDAPDEVQCFASFAHAGAAFDVPQQHHGEPMLMLSMLHRGPVDQGRESLRPLRSIVEPVVDLVGEQRYHDGASYPPAGFRNRYDSRFLRALPDGAIDRLVESATPLPGRHSTLVVTPLGGAISRIDATATAFPHRDAAFILGIYAHWSDPQHDTTARAWSQRLCDAVAPHSTGAYLNNQPEGGEGGARAAFGTNYERLMSLKARWDPDALFSAQ
ncbi:MAG: FAD-binding oxidoreductase [Nitriliruptorales bacterium]|nr:FAD-binding oxidoreductase [Nitriliruptorales bacterium]